MIVIFLLIMLIIVIYVFLNYKQKKDNFLSKEMLLDNSNYNNNNSNYNNSNCKFKNIEIETFLSNKQKYKDVDELMMKPKKGETIYDVTSV
jgi:hypothetical protein